MSVKSAENSTAPISKRQVKLLYQIFKLEQLIDDAIQALVKEVNSREILTYQEETEGESNITSNRREDQNHL